MKKFLFVLFFIALIASSVYAMGAPQAGYEGGPGFGFFSFLPFLVIIAIIAIVAVTISNKNKEKQEQNNASTEILQKSIFDGSFWHLVGLYIGGFLLCLITLGIAFPWVYCWFTKWRINNTVVSGKRLQFNGAGIELLGHFILKGWLLGIILGPLTLGLYWIYYFNVSLRKWEVKNTTFSDGGIILNKPLK